LAIYDHLKVTPQPGETKMLRRVVSICTFALTAAALAIPAGAPVSAKGYRVYKATRDAPIKDCTRVNGRYGYYGNPWCTAAEQARWDRWSAGRR
jgi:hypothetical protein